MRDEILECGHPATLQEAGSCTTGYGTDPKDGKRYCFACCADRDRASMIETGRAVLYLESRTVQEPMSFADGVRTSSREVWSLSNWPGSLKFSPFWVTRSKGYGFGRSYPREDFRFNGPDGFVWYGMRQGNNTQLAHCRRTKTRIKD